MPESKVEKMAVLGVNESLYLPLDTIDIWQITSYQKVVPSPNDPSVSEIHQTLGLVKDGRFHPYRGFNQFLKESWPLPPWPEWSNMLDVWIEEWKDEKDENETQDAVDVYVSKAWDAQIQYWKESVFDPTARIFVPPSPHPILQLLNVHTLLRTEDNGGTGFLVILGDNVVHIFGRTNDVIEECTRKAPDQCLFSLSSTLIYPEWLGFTECIATYRPLNYWIGESHKNEMTEFSGGHGSKWTGNSILLQISPIRYVFIGRALFEFDSHESILRYVSSVGNNRVPYPYAETDNWYIDLTYEFKILKTLAPDTVKKGIIPWNADDTDNHQPIDNVTRIATRGTDSGRYPQSAMDDYTCTSPSNHPHAVQLLKGISLTFCSNTSK